MMCLSDCIMSLNRDFQESKYNSQWNCRPSPYEALALSMEEGGAHVLKSFFFQKFHKSVLISKGFSASKTGDFTIFFNFGEMGSSSKDFLTKMGWDPCLRVIGKN